MSQPRGLTRNETTALARIGKDYQCALSEASNAYSIRFDFLGTKRSLIFQEDRKLYFFDLEEMVSSVVCELTDHDIEGRTIPQIVELAMRRAQNSDRMIELQHPIETPTVSICAKEDVRDLASQAAYEIDEVLQRYGLRARASVWLEKKKS